MMMGNHNKTILLASACLLCGIASGTGSYPAAGARAFSLGGCGLMLGDAFSAANNSALMPGLSKPEIGLSLLNHYMLADINHLVICAAIPLNRIAYGIQLMSYGNSAYREQTLGFSCAHSMHERFSFGLAAKYQHFSISGYGSNAGFMTDISTSLQINEKLRMSFSANNMLATGLGNERKPVYTKGFFFGLLYKVNTAVEMVAEMEKRGAFKTCIKAGLQYKMHPSFYLLLGFSSIQPQCAFGIEIRKQAYKISLAFSASPAPGISSSLSFIYEIGR